MIDAILWDFDGTLVNSESHHMQAELETFHAFGANITEEQNKKYQGKQLVDQVKEIVSTFNLSHTPEEILTYHRDIQKKYARSIFPLVPHAKKVLRDLSKRYTMALVTSGEKEMVDILLDRFDIRKYFSAIICAEDVTKGKPDPEPFLKVAELLVINPGQAIVIEDAFNGITAAKKAGMKVILKKHTTNKHLDPSLADFSVSSLEEIPSIIASL